VLAPALEAVPAGHKAQASLAAALLLPASHEVQAASPVAE